MAQMDLKEILEKMLAASRGVLDSQWNEVEPFAALQYRALAENFQLIERLKATGKITEEQAIQYIEIQKSSVRMVLLTTKGIARIKVEQAVNAALGAVKDLVNTAIGWKIL